MKLKKSITVYIIHIGIAKRVLSLLYMEKTRFAIFILFLFISDYHTSSTITFIIHASISCKLSFCFIDLFYKIFPKESLSSSFPCAIKSFNNGNS